MIKQRAAQAPPDLLSAGGRPRASRAKQLTLIVDHCAVAKALAEQMGNQFLAYLLAMSIQEASGRLALETDGDGNPTDADLETNAGD